MNNVKLLPSLIIFAEVAKRHSFTAAAKHLGLSKSAVSQHITKLEEQLRVQLIVRHTRALTLTASGQKLLARSENLQGQVAQALEDVLSHEESPSGRLSVTAPSLLQRPVLVPALKQLCREYPNIEPHIVVADEPLDLINDKLDVAIFSGDLPDSQYRMMPIGTVTERVYMAPDYIREFGAPDHLDQLKEHRWIAADWQLSGQDSGLCFYDTTHQHNQTVDISPYIRCNSLTCVLDLVWAGVGFSLVPDVQDRRADWPGDGRQGREALVPVLDGWQGKTWPFYFVHSFLHKKPVHVKRLYELVKYYFQQATRVQ